MKQYAPTQKPGCRTSDLETCGRKPARDLATLAKNIAPLFRGDDSYKVAKGSSKGYITGILYLKPVDSGGHSNVCPFASEGCKLACLVSSGRGQQTNVQIGRQRKTDLFFTDRQLFMYCLVRDTKALIRKAKREGVTPCIRLNGTSDLPWEKIPVNGYRNIFEMFPDVQWYDYTKNPHRFRHVAKPGNYHLTFSRSESNDKHVQHVIENTNWKIAIVFSGAIPKTWQFNGKKYRVIDGDETDLRFLDKGGRIVGLTAKGKGKRDASGFVIHN